MKQNTPARIAVLTNMLEEAREKRRSRRRARILSPWVCSVLAALGIFGGISSLFVGIVAVILHSIIPGDLIFNQVGTGLLIAAIPMILIGSIFVDEIEGKK